MDDIYVVKDGVRVFKYPAMEAAWQRMKPKSTEEAYERRIFAYAWMAALESQQIYTGRGEDGNR